MKNTFFSPRHQNRVTLQLKFEVLDLTIEPFCNLSIDDKLVVCSNIARFSNLKTVILASEVREGRQLKLNDIFDETELNCTLVYKLLEN